MGNKKLSTNEKNVICTTLRVLPIRNGFFSMLELRLRNLHILFLSMIGTIFRNRKLRANEKNVEYRKSQVLPIRDGNFFNIGNMTPKLAHIVLINDRNNMCKGISQNLKIEHKRKNVKYHKSQGNGAYPTITAKNDIAVFFNM